MIKIVPLTKHVDPKNVLTHALPQHVVLELYVKLISTLPFVSVLLVCRVIHFKLALKLAAAETQTVPPMRNVTSFLVDSLQGGNASPFAILESAYLVLTAQPEITRKPVLADTH